MPKLSVILVVLVALVTGSVAAWAKRDDLPFQQHPWRLAFADDFNGNRLDTAKWTTCFWWEHRHSGCTNTATGERQWYLRHNVHVANGALHLVAHRKTVRPTGGRSFPYTSGMVTTGPRRFGGRPGFAFTYGRVEARIRAPRGSGLWSAVWLLPTRGWSRPEIDVAEVRGSNPRSIHSHVHYVQGGRPRDVGGGWRGPDATAGWHVYAVDWSPTKITWTIDGRTLWTFGNRAYVPRTPMYLLLNLAVGGGWGGRTDRRTPFPSSLDVDYVRVWKRSA